MSETLLQTAERGDLPTLIERLDYVSRRIHCVGRGGNPLLKGDALIDEALWYARHGDLNEATLRLRLRARPKFRSAQQCQAAYDTAMADKRARAAQ